MSDEIFETPRATYTLQELKDRIGKVEGHPIIRMLEVPQGTPDTLRVMATYVVELGEALDVDKFGIIVDLVEADGAPTSGYRRAIPKYVKEILCVNAHYVTIAFQGQPMARMAAKLLVRGLAKNVSVHNNYDDALQRTLDELGQ